MEGFDEAGEPIGARWRPLGGDRPALARGLRGQGARDDVSFGASADEPRPPADTALGEEGAEEVTRW